MSPTTIIRELRDGQSAAARTGLLWLVLGAMATCVVVFLMSPAMGGLTALPGQLLDGPRHEAKTRPATPPLTPKQRMVARRTSVRVALEQVGVRERAPTGAARSRATGGP